MQRGTKRNGLLKRAIRFFLCFRMTDPNTGITAITTSDNIRLRANEMETSWFSLRDDLETVILYAVNSSGIQGALVKVANTVPENLETSKNKEVYQAFLIRLWRRQDRFEVRCIVKNVHNGEEHAFADLEHLFLFLEAKDAN